MPPAWTVLILIGFGAIVFLTMQLKCWGGGIGFPAVWHLLNGLALFLLLRAGLEVGATRGPAGFLQNEDRGQA